MVNASDLEKMDLEERKARLAKIARNHNFTRQFRASDVVSAIDLLNKIDNMF